MMIHKVYRLICACALVPMAMATMTTVAQDADEEIILPDPIEILSDTLVVQNQSDNSSVGSQEKISGLSNETQELLGEYRLVLQQIDRLIAYNDYVERLIEDQESQIVDINNQLVEFALIERGIVPLMLDSIETIDKFILSLIHI